MKHAIDVKTRNYIDGINQAVKKISDVYYMNGSGLILPTDESKKITKGRHFTLVNDADRLQKSLKLSNSSIVRIHADHIYMSVKENKKTIDGIVIDEAYNNIGFSNGENKSLFFGELIGEDDNEEYDKYSKYALNKIGNIADIEMKPFSEETVTLLLENNLITLTEGNYHVRITKEIFPHISLKTPINVGFRQKEDNENLFEFIVTIKKGEVTNYHIYTCIHFKGDVIIC